MRIGPVEVLICTLPGASFDPRAVEAIDETVRSGAVALLDMAVIRMDGRGRIWIQDVRESVPEDWRTLFVDPDPVLLLSQDDLDEAATLLSPNQVAVILAIEHRWASRLADRIIRLSGSLVLHARVPQGAAEAAYRAGGIPGT